LNQNKEGAFLMELTELNYMAILAGGIVYMIYGGIYYSITVGKGNGKQGEGSFKYVFSVLTAFISSLLVALLVQATGAESAVAGLFVGLAIGVLIILVYYKNTLFGLMSKNSFFIAIGDHLVVFTLLGLINGLMT
jgi:hypothetical protein